MCKVISLVNQKGGVSKSTSAINIGIGLSKMGKRILIIDNDPQGSATASLSISRPDELEITLKNILEKVIDDEEISDDEGVIHIEEGIDLLPSNIELSGLEVSLVNVMSREQVLKSYIDSIKHKYDYVIIDCSPSLGMLTINALTAADSVIIPVQAAYLPVKGLEQLLETIKRVKKYLNKKIVIDGILISMVDTRTNIAKDIIEVINEAYGKQIRIFDTMIPFSVRAVESSAKGVSIYKHDKNGKLANAYRKLCEEVLSL
ncbi:MAG TPA: chromosome partitioning protein ParA [Eubacterium sp.]|nr:chromosome partitioning protein ParA [Eubacterium sp.]